MMSFSLEDFLQESYLVKVKENGASCFCDKVHTGVSFTEGKTKLV